MAHRATQYHEKHRAVARAPRPGALRGQRHRQRREEGGAGGMSPRKRSGRGGHSGHAFHGQTLGNRTKGKP